MIPTRDAPAAVPLPRPTAPLVTIACLAALVFGAALPVAPWTVAAVSILVPLAFAAPVASLTVLLAVTVLVPFEVQDSFAVFGGRDRPGLLVVDVLMLLGLIRVAALLLRGRQLLDRRVLAGLAVAVIMTVALLWGCALGASVSEAGHEMRRVILGCGTFLLALPLVDDATARKRLERSMLGIALALALWGLAQWFLSVGYTTSGDVGIRPGVDLTSSGHGQLQGGMYAYPVAVILAWAVVLSGRHRDMRVQALVTTILLLNGMCLVLTFERSLWGATAIGCVLVALLSGPAGRRRSVPWAVGGLTLMVVAAAVAPGQARTAVERLLSIRQVTTDTSVTARLVESRAVIDAIIQRPFAGSGFGATVTWGQRDTFATVTTPFAHNGYLWLAWKIGIPAALLVVALIAAAICRRVRDDSDWAALRRGSQASLVAMLVICIVFPVFNVLGITAAMGFLAAVCCSREPR
ncbi:O-antigen ligase [Mycolicibacterium rutilum]|uniref:O-antigen ligase n=1 Tax=Mycolicibacterium rutilum TaxID=370526 RepID=A0A1H6INF6_MYCRU|nr:O-antigen ligase family protein [Mycolicibacterium rutilum]SEH50241.1 O-antigen ligase [Mycolicibacterium rutilum]